MIVLSEQYHSGIMAAFRAEAEFQSEIEFTNLLATKEGGLHNTQERERKITDWNP